MTADSGNGEPDADRRSIVDRMYHELDELLALRQRMDNLLRLIPTIGMDLEIDATLRRIVTAAMELTGARYGALGVRGPDGGLTSFLHVGFDAETVRLIGDLPRGVGLLGAILQSTDPVRLADVRTHPSSVGFPEHHPPVRAFLGIPITIRDVVFGSVYLADDRPGWEFADTDESIVRALAAAAAVSIANARLFERVTMSATWMEASRTIVTTVLGGDQSRAHAFQLIADRARDLTDAAQAIVLVPLDSTDEDDQDDQDDNGNCRMLVVSAASGHAADKLLGHEVPVDASTTGEVFRTGAPLITETFRYPIPAFTDAGNRQVIVMPLRTLESVMGVIALASASDQRPFDPRYLDLVGDFADHAAIALTLAAAGERERELSLLAERDRIARDLHDHVIQRLFAAGMNLQSTIARAESPETSERLNHTVDELQAIIEDIRATIFELQTPPGRPADLQQRLRQLVAELTADLDMTTTLRFTGPTAGLSARLADDADAVITEAVSNAVRHACASRLTIDVDVGNELTIHVADDGCGIPVGNRRHSGLANMKQRAELAGGSCKITSPPEGGTCVVWTAPVTSG